MWKTLLAVSVLLTSSVTSRRLPADAADATDDIKQADDFEVTDDAENELWLADFDGGAAPRYTDYAAGGMQADAPSAPRRPALDSAWVCPPPPLGTPPSYHCLMKRCKADSQCARPTQKCCYNGCVYSCLNTLPPPPLVDWIKEPPRRLLAGNSWLVQGPEMMPDGDSCTTDFAVGEEDALLCAHGYICHITHPGDKTKGLPNRGRCIKDSHSETLGPRKFRLADNQQHRLGNEVCVYENAIFVDGADFMYQQHICECLKGTITCTVGED